MDTPPVLVSGNYSIHKKILTYSISILLSKGPQHMKVVVDNLKMIIAH